MEFSLLYVKSLRNIWWELCLAASSLLENEKVMRNHEDKEKSLWKENKEEQKRL